MKRWSFKQVAIHMWIVPQIAEKSRNRNRWDRQLLRYVEINSDSLAVSLQFVSHQKWLPFSAHFYTEKSQKSISPEMELSHSAQAAITKYHWWRGLNSRFLYLTVLEAGSPRSRYWQIGFLVRALFLAYRQQPVGCVLTQGRAREREREGETEGEN